jgi:hypothetical protein
VWKEMERFSVRGSCWGGSHVLSDLNRKGAASSLQVACKGASASPDVAVIPDWPLRSLPFVFQKPGHAAPGRRLSCTISMFSQVVASTRPVAFADAHHAAPGIVGGCPAAQLHKAIRGHHIDISPAPLLQVFTYNTSITCSSSCSPPLPLGSTPPVLLGSVTPIECPSANASRKPSPPEGSHPCRLSLH